MFISFFAYLFLFIGLLILVLPLILVELSRPRDWLIGGLFLFLGLFLLVENDILRGSINLLVVSMAILYGKMMSEIIQTRWYQLSFEEKKRIWSFERWFQSFQQLGKIFAHFGNNCLIFFKKFFNETEKPIKEKKWVHPELKEQINKKVVYQSDLTDSNQLRNKELAENEETS
tara:strand:+ start:576 stop:1094 length:519 start_codon:yes stop_codon:yes gene_type:complete